ncbi:DUF4174 domain-containing protein [Marinovum sp.]|uniref:DUF4174 domain-containing protein n=1 Tax=Marinovum sp. TaxID=2024839 RepID=UPI003A9027C3
MYRVLTMIFAAAATGVAAQELAVAQGSPAPEAAPVAAEEVPQGTEEAAAATEAIEAEPVIQPAGLHELEEYLWLKRPVVVFADSPADPRFQQQMDLLQERLEELAERDVVVLTDTDASVLTPLREKLRPRGFMLVLIGKDGSVYLRKPFPWSVREITRSIDKLPLRQQEIRDRRNSG